MNTLRQAVPVKPLASGDANRSDPIHVLLRCHETCLVRCSLHDLIMHRKKVRSIETCLQTLVDDTNQWSHDCMDISRGIRRCLLIVLVLFQHMSAQHKTTCLINCDVASSGVWSDSGDEHSCDQHT